MNRAKPRTKCRYHCVPCNTHFHSLKAFDAHRQGDHGSNHPQTGRHCVHPLDLIDAKGALRLEALTTSGVCDIRETLQAPVTIWALQGTREVSERLTARSRSSQGVPQTEREGPNHP